MEVGGWGSLGGGGTALRVSGQVLVTEHEGQVLEPHTK